MDIKGLERLNAKINKLTAIQNNKSDEIKQIVDDKSKLLDEFVNDNANDISGILDDLDSIKNGLYKDVYSLQRCKAIFHRCYAVAFKDAVTKTIETKLLNDSSRHGWGYGKSNIWINRRGVATKGYSRTSTIVNTEQIINVLNDMKNLKSYIKESRKELVGEIVDCAQKMKGTKLSREIYGGELPNKIKYIIATNIYSTNKGVTDVKLGELKYLSINVNNARVEVSIREKKDSYFWNSKNFPLTNSSISYETKFVLSQIPEDARQKIHKFKEEVELIKSHNKKLLDKLTEEITPYMVMESL